MRTANLCATALFVGLLLPIGSAFGQHNWKQTVTVDPFMGAADHQTIQAAINDPKIGNNPTVRFTVLIFAGTYTENVTLNGFKENVDLVGIDRESVIIAPTSAGSGIKITSGDETSRNNRIANLTIITDDGHGIEIVKGLIPVPKDITIEGVTISAAGSGMEGVTGKDATDVSLVNCDVTSNAGNGIEVGDDWTLNQVIVDTTEDSTIDQNGIFLDQKDNVTIVNSDISGERRALFCKSSTNALVVGCRFFTPGGGGPFMATVYFQGASKGFVFQNCLIISDATASINDRGGPRGVFTDLSGNHDVLFQSCTVSAIGDDVSVEAVAVQSDVPGTMRFVDCDLSATNKPDAGDPSAPAGAVGVRTSAQSRVVLIGGVISTSSAAEKETEVWDLDDRGSLLEISGTRFSKWKGAIASAERPRAVTQRILNVDSADAALIVDSADLDGDTIIVGSPGILDAYRTVQATWNFATGADITITVAGTNWADEEIVEAFLLKVGFPNVKGLKPFKTVTDIFIPSVSGTLSVGTTNRFGLYYPIASISDVLQEALLVSGVYTDQNVGTVDAVYSTVIPSSTITDGDSFEWALLASQ